MWLAAICGAAVAAWAWRASRRPKRLPGDELQRLRRIAESVRREGFQPYD